MTLQRLIWPTLCLVWLLLLGAGAVHAQSIDEVKKKLASATTDMEKAKLYAQLATLSLNAGNTDATIEYANKSMELSKNPSDQAVLMPLAKSYQLKKQYATSLNFYLQAQKELAKAGNKAALANTNMDIGHLYKEWGVNEKAIEYYLPAYDLYKQLKDEANQIQVLSDLVVAYQSIPDNEKALAFNAELLDIYEANADKKRIINALSNISNLNLRLNRPEASLENQLRILKLNQELNDSLGIASAYNNIGFLYKRLQKYELSLESFTESMKYGRERNPVTLVNIGVIHQVLGHYEPSLLAFFEAAKIRETEKNGAEVAHVCNYIAAEYQSFDDSENALRYVERAIQFGEANKNLEALMDSYRIMSDIYTSLGRNKKALAYYKMYADAKDVLQEQEKNKLQQELAQRYDAEKKENELKLLLVDKEVNQLSLRRLQLEAEKKEKEYQLQLQEQELANTVLKQQELEKSQFLAQLTLEKQRIEAEKKDQEISMLQTSDSLQRMTLKQKELEETERQKDIELLKQREELNALQRKEEQERAAQEREIFFIILIAAAFVIIGAIIAAILKQRDNNKLKKQRRLIEEQNSRLNNQNLKLQEQSDEISVQAEELMQQRDEIMAQRDYIEDKNKELENQRNAIQKAFDNITTLSEIGQKITSTLDLSVIIHTVYESVNKLMKATSFGIGIYSEKLDALEFKDFMEKDEVLPYSVDYLKEASLPSVRCFVNKEEIFINNLKEAYSTFSISTEENRGEIPASLIYLPLMVEERAIGVVTVQSFEENAYSQADLTLLRSLASYASIALDNSRAYAMLQEVNEIIKDKNQQITDSLRYARTIEESILPTQAWFEAHFADHFVLYRPKDIVSGDFYWGYTHNGVAFLAVVDCTGHGVPGAFMSMIGNAVLNRVVKENRIFDPGAVLTNLNYGIREVLQQQEHENSEGMDVCFCRIEPAKDGSIRVDFAGAKRSLYYIEEGELKEVKGDRISIGWPYRRTEAQESMFATETLSLKPGTQLYLTTDGYADNPGINGKSKIGSPLLKETLIQNQKSPMDDQVEALLELLLKAQEEREQRDDITVLGIKLKA